MITANIIGYTTSAQGTEKVQSVNPSTKTNLEEAFTVATQAEVYAAADKAEQAWHSYRLVSGAEKARFLRAIATEIEALGDELVKRVILESGLPEGRVRGERGRTCSQLRLFADLVEEGNWVEAKIETALPERKPIPRADIRTFLQSIGPVVVFGASNFPLAFSTAGGDTASALAAGAPVIVKAHPSHLGTNALIAAAIQKAAKDTNMPDGVFSAVQDAGRSAGAALVQHPKVKAVAFTGSLRGGMAIYKAAAARAEPIPVFAEMGSVNPIFLLPNKVAQQHSTLATQLANSINLGAGQFCTNPGLLILIEDENTPTLLRELQAAFGELTQATMLNEGIHKSFEVCKKTQLASPNVQIEAQQPNSDDWKAAPTLASVAAEDFLANPNLQDEVFGPFSLLVKCKNKVEMESVAKNLHGQLTATIMGETDELSDYTDLFQSLQEKAGRVIFNGVPTGVEVCHSMQHGGPFPATTDSRFTSVGTAAIRRFVRPLAFQNCPDALLPAALKAANPLDIWRLENGVFKR